MLNPDLDSMPIRILLANLTPLTASILRQLIADQSDMTVVDVVEGNLEKVLIAADGMDMVIITTQYDKSPANIILKLLDTYPFLKVFLLETHKNAATGYWLDIQKRNFHISNNAKLIHQIRHLHKSQRII